MTSVEREYELTSALIMAAENWGNGYQEAPVQHARLIRIGSRLERKLIQFFKDQAEKAPTFINWWAYRQAIEAYELDVIVNDVAIEEGNNEFITVVFEDITFATAIGAQAGETIYNVPLGLDSLDSVIQREAREHTAYLVGKKLDKSGAMIDNPRADYRITDKMRNDIRQSIQTSITLGEKVDDATIRLQKTIKNPRRALTIAQTEVVNAYDGGMDVFGRESGAIGKEWEDNGSIDVCAEYASLGPVPFGYLYGGKLRGPAAHPRCKCHRRLIYQSELDQNPNLFR